MATNVEDFSDELHNENCLQALKALIDAISGLDREDQIRLINCLEKFYALDV